MEEYLELISVPAIALIVYWVIFAIRYAVKENETFDRFVPLIAAVLGVALGVVAYFAVPEIMPTENVVVALVIGGASGLSATGVHQAIKQIKKKDDKTETPPEDEGKK